MQKDESMPLDGQGLSLHQYFDTVGLLERAFPEQVKEEI